MHWNTMSIGGREQHYFQNYLNSYVNREETVKFVSWLFLRKWPVGLFSVVNDSMYMCIRPICRNHVRVQPCQVSLCLLCFNITYYALEQFSGFVPITVQREFFKDNKFHFFHGFHSYFENESSKILLQYTNTMIIQSILEI